MLWKFTSGAALLLSTAAANAGPAVSNTNFKFMGLGGSAEVANTSDSAWTAIGALTAPLGQSWGLQVEAGASGFGGDTGFGAAAHVFQRDPDHHLIGVFVAHASVDDADLSATRFGVEGELYFEKISLLGAVGYQTSDDIEDGAFGIAQLRLYATDDLALSISGAALEEAAYGQVAAEWRIAPVALPGVALRAEAAFGDDDYSAIMGGLTVYFGENASLKDRHRGQDPDSALFNLFQGLQASQSAPPAAPPPVIFD